MISTLNVTHAVCGDTDSWVDSDAFSFRECFYEHGQLIGETHRTDSFSDTEPGNYVAGQWTSSCTSDAGRPSPLESPTHQGC